MPFKSSVPVTQGLQIRLWLSPSSPDQQGQRGPEPGNPRDGHQHVPDRRLWVRNLEKLHESILQTEQGNGSVSWKAGTQITQAACTMGAVMQPPQLVGPTSRPSELTQPLFLISQSRRSLNRYSEISCAT